MRLGSIILVSLRLLTRKPAQVYDEKLPTGDRMYGKSVTVINRSEIVGRPLAAMLANDGADVYSVDMKATCPCPDHYEQPRRCHH